MLCYVGAGFRPAPIFLYYATKGRFETCPYGFCISWMYAIKGRFETCPYDDYRNILKTPFSSILIIFDGDDGVLSSRLNFTT